MMQVDKAQDFSFLQLDVLECRSSHDAPSFHMIYHVFYHTSFDTQGCTSERGQKAVARAYLKILDNSMKYSLAEMEGPNFATPKP